jgi:hypothetical protein
MSEFKETGRIGSDGQPRVAAEAEPALPETDSAFGLNLTRIRLIRRRFHRLPLAIPPPWAGIMRL